MKQLVLNIDGNEIDNFIITTLISKINASNTNIEIIQYPKKAIQHLQNLVKDSYQRIPKIIFLNLQMPLLTGFQVLDALQEINIMTQTKVYLVSCFFAKEDIQKIKDYPHLAGYIQKPFTLNKLKKILEVKQNKVVID